MNRKARGTLRLSIFFLIASLSLLALSCAPEGGDEREGEEPRGEATGQERSGGGPPPGAGRGREGAQELGVAEEGSRSRTIQVAGRLRPRVRISHDTPVSGVVRELMVESGERVSRGDPLFTVERIAVGQTFRPVPVEARIDGVVSEVHVQVEEELIQGSEGVTVVSGEDYILEARISDKDATDILVGREVLGRTSGGDEVAGRLIARGQEPDYETGLFTLTFQFDQDPLVSIGTFLSIELPTREIPGVFGPREAVGRRSGRFFRWVVGGGEVVVTRRGVEVEQGIGGGVRVEGLSPGGRYLATLTGRERGGSPGSGSGSGSGPENGEGPGREG